MGAPWESMEECRRAQPPSGGASMVGLMPVLMMVFVLIGASLGQVTLVANVPIPISNQPVGPTSISSGGFIGNYGAVGLASTVDYTLSLFGASSSTVTSGTEFLVNPNSGASSGGGTCTPSGPGSAVLEFATPQLVGSGSITQTSLAAGHVLRVLRMQSSSGSQDLLVTGDPSLRWFLFPTTQINWLNRGQRAAEGGVGGPGVTVAGGSDFALVVVRDGGVAATDLPFTARLGPIGNHFTLSGPGAVASNLTATAYQFTATVPPGRWTAVGSLGSVASAYTISIGNVTQLATTSMGYALANGRLGTISPTDGLLARSGTSAGTFHQATVQVATVGTPGREDLERGRGPAHLRVRDRHGGALRPRSHRSERTRMGRIRPREQRDLAAADDEPDVGLPGNDSYRDPAVDGMARHGRLEERRGFPLGPGDVHGRSDAVVARPGAEFPVTFLDSGRKRGLHPYREWRLFRQRGFRAPLGRREPHDHLREWDPVDRSGASDPGRRRRHGERHRVHPGAGGRDLRRRAVLDRESGACGDLGDTGFRDRRRPDVRPEPHRIRVRARSDGVLEHDALSTTVGSPTQLTASVPAALIASPGTAAIRIFNPSPGGGLSAPFGVTVRSPTITQVLSPSIPILVATSAPVGILISGTDFLPGAVAYADSTALPTVVFGSTLIQASIGPNVPGATRRGGLAIAVENGHLSPSNALGLAVGGGSNRGTIVRHPLRPSLGEAYSAVLESGTPSAPLVLLADLQTPAPVYPFPNASADFVLGVRPAAIGQPDWLPLIDSIGIYGAPFGPNLDAGGRLVLSGFVAPSPALGISLSLQGAYLDPTSPAGFRMTWSRFPDEL